MISRNSMAALLFVCASSLHAATPLFDTPRLPVGPAPWAVALADLNGNGYIDDLTGWDSVSNSNDAMDTNGHGTDVSGIIAARGDNGVGVAGVN
jgi:subtilisin family serine protease